MATGNAWKLALIVQYLTDRREIWNTVVPCHKRVLNGLDWMDPCPYVPCSDHSRSGGCRLRELWGILVLHHSPVVGTWQTIRAQNIHYFSTTYQRNISIPNFTSISQRLRGWCKFSCAAPDLLASDLPFVDRRFWIDLARLVVTRSLVHRSNWNSNMQNAIYKLTLEPNFSEIGCKTPKLLEFLMR